MGKTWMWLGIVALLSIAFFTGACGGTSTTGSTMTNGAAGMVGQKVLAILDQGNTVIERDRSIGNQAASFKAISHDFAIMAQGLQVLNFAASIQADQKTLVSAFKKLSGDATEIANAANKTEVRAIATKMDDDEETAKAASDTLRRDLGLPSAD